MRRDRGTRRFAEKRHEKRALATYLVASLVFFALASVMFAFRANWLPTANDQAERMLTWLKAKRDKPIQVAKKPAPKKMPVPETEPAPIHFQFYATLPETRLHPTIKEDQETALATQPRASAIKPADIDHELSKQLAGKRDHPS